MTKLLTKLRNNREEIYAIASKYGVSNIRVFGSVARGEENKNSDIDLLVDIDYKTYGSGFARVDFKDNLEQVFHVPIDIITTKSLHCLLKKQILQEAKPL